MALCIHSNNLPGISDAPISEIYLDNLILKKTAHSQAYLGATATPCRLQYDSRPGNSKSNLRRATGLWIFNAYHGHVCNGVLWNSKHSVALVICRGGDLPSIKIYPGTLWRAEVLIYNSHLGAGAAAVAIQFSRSVD